MSKRMLIAAATGLSLAIVVLVVVIATVPAIKSWLTISLTALRHRSSPPAADAPVPTPTPDPFVPITIALLGYGGGGHAGGKLTDSIIVAQIQPKTQVVTLISVPRDLWIELPIAADQLKPFKINAAYAIGSDTRQYLNRPAEFQGTHGGGNLAKKSLEQVVGFPIDYYVAVSFANFETSVEALGGVDVDVPFAFSDSFYPIEGKEQESCDRTPEDISALTATMSGYALEQQFPCRYETITFAKGRQHLDAQTALKFVRSRHSGSNGSDFGRSLRQQAFLKAVKQKIFSLSFIPQLLPFIEKNSRGIATDIDLGLVSKLLTLYKNPADFKLQSISLSDQNVLMAGRSSDGQYILKPKDQEHPWESVAAFIAQTEIDLATSSAQTATNSTLTTTPTVVPTTAQ